MKNLLFAFVLLLAVISESHAQFWAKDNGRFGIGDQDPIAKLQVNAMSSFSNPGIALLDSSATNASGGILQFRSINWDDNHFNIQARIGEYAFGQDSKLDFFFRENLIMSIEGGITADHQLVYNPRDGIFRTGLLNPGARGQYSVAMGFNNLASGYSSVALGSGSQAIGENSTVLGGSSTASASYSTTIGYDNVASGPFSLAAGKQASAFEVNAVALGDSVVASGAASHAIGYKTLASAHSSTATGNQTEATGLYSFAAGYATLASNTSSTAFGFVSQATGVSASAFGFNTLAAGENAVAFNSITKALGANSVSSGFDTKTIGWASSAFGDHTTTRSYASAVFGAYNDTLAASNPDGWVITDPLLMVGNGLSNTERNNAFTIYKNGDLLARRASVVSGDPGLVSLPASGSGTRMMWIQDKSAFRVGSVSDDSWDAANIGGFSLATGINTKATGVSSTAFGNNNTASGSVSTAMGYLTEATGSYSTAVGYSTLASGSRAIAMGNSTEASGIYSTSMGSITLASGGISTAMGYNTESSGDYATAMGYGTYASGTHSTAMGYNVNASGDASTAMGWSTHASGWMTAALGRGTVANAFTSTAIGSYNDEMEGSSETTWVDTDPLLYIGNGENGSAPSNAMVVYKNGNTDINGYTRLGSEADVAPRIKMKELSIPNTASTNNGYVSIAHDMDASKILSVNVLIEWLTGYYAPPEYAASLNIRYGYYVSATNIVIQNNTPVGDCLICSKQGKILITYKE